MIKMSRHEMVHMLGYLTHRQMIDAVRNESVSASSMINICEYMNEHYWGGYDGCIRYCKFFQEDKELAKMFEEWFMSDDDDGEMYDIDNDGTIYNGTEDIKDTEENFRKEYAKRKEMKK